jgi:hypothetical protein
MPTLTDKDDARGLLKRRIFSVLFSKLGKFVLPNLIVVKMNSLGLLGAARYAYLLGNLILGFTGVIILKTGLRQLNLVDRGVI